MKKQAMKSLIIKLSKENSLITQFTSFIAVEQRVCIIVNSKLNSSIFIYTLRKSFFNWTVAHTCNPSRQEAEARGSQVLGQPGLHREDCISKKRKKIQKPNKTQGL
jgi:hypothetical protein